MTSELDGKMNWLFAREILLLGWFAIYLEMTVTSRELSARDELPIPDPPVAKCL